MAQNAQTVEARRDSSLKYAAPPGREGGFKPVALPALAAAVHATKRKEGRMPAQREIPSILREDALLD